MDAKRFDRLARDVNHVGTRRVALRLLGGGALAGASALLGGEAAAARCQAPRKCGRNRCCPKGQICGDKATKTCVTGKGTCSAGDNRCLDPENTCNGNDLCGCRPRKEDGKTRCVSLIGLGGCCGSDADCVRDNPDVPGAACFNISDCTNDGCQTNAEPFNGDCYAPCPST